MRSTILALNRLIAPHLGRTISVVVPSISRRGMRSAQRFGNVVSSKRRFSVTGRGASGSVAFEHHNYDLVTVLAAESIGVPGQRRFRLISGIGADVVSLWMEKEQLNALGQAIGQLLEQLTESGLVSEPVLPNPTDVAGSVPPGSPEYLVSKIMIGYDEERSLIAIFAHDIEQED